MSVLNVRKIIHDYNERIKRVDNRYQLTASSICAIYDESRNDCYTLLKNSFFVGYEQGYRASKSEAKKKTVEATGFAFHAKQRHMIAGGEISPFERIVIGDLRHADPETRQAVFKLLGIDGEEVVV